MHLITSEESIDRSIGQSVPLLTHPRVALSPPLRRRQELKDGIAQFYDESSAIWEEIWGEHMHHGWYYTGKERDHQKAQVGIGGFHGWRSGGLVDRFIQSMDGWMA